MRIERLLLTQFRNINSLDLKFDQDFIVLVGPNGVGKTSILESIHYCSLLSAFPPGKSWELIEFDNDFFRIEAITDTAKYEYYYGRKTEKKYARSQSIDGARKRSHEILGSLPTVSFLPTDLNLLILSPTGRRGYMDEILLQTENNYEIILTEFDKTLTQRNELLSRIREGEAKESELDIWDEKLIEFAAPIITARGQLAEYFNDGLEEFYEEVTGEARDLSFHYVAPYLKNGDPLEDTLRAKRKEDIASAKTNVGPHRDDWRIEDKEGRNLARYFSRGEQRSAIICLKLKEHSRLLEALEKAPIILFDEVLAELDETRKTQILEHLPKESQVFLTTASENDLPESILSSAQIIELKK